jgi:hypothetical protein
MDKEKSFFSVEWFTKRAKGEYVKRLAVLRRPVIKFNNNHSWIPEMEMYRWLAVPDQSIYCNHNFAFFHTKVHKTSTQSQEYLLENV